MKIFFKIRTFYVSFILYFLVFSSMQSQNYFNPILAGFYPDPSICRVKKDFYLVNSTFSYFPGVPIFHSTDMVHWRQIGHVLADTSQLNLDELGVSEGIYAPAITHHNGLFYMITTLVGRGGNFVVTTKNPEGPWSKPYWLPALNGIDPSLFFDDDGKAYVVFNSVAPDDNELYSGHRTIRMYEFDYKNNTTTGPEYILVNGGTDLKKQPIWIEGPHLYKKDGFYFLMAAEGGTSTNHSEVIFRSKSVNGPYIPFENNPILTQRHLDPNRNFAITSTGHADLIETENGEWWAVFLGCRPYPPYSQDLYNTGRETFMAPVRWINGWPVINPDYEEVQYTYKVPGLPVNNISSFPLNGNFTLTEHFDNKKLPYYWMFLRTPRSTWFSLTDEPSYLKMELRPETCSEMLNPAMLLRRQQHANFNVSAKMDFTPKSENEFSGMIAFQNDKSYYAIGKSLIEGETYIKLIKSMVAPERGKGRSIMNPVSVREDSMIYKSERYGRELNYSFPVKQGVPYSLTLKFAELYHEKAGARLFDVKVEDRTVLENFDIFKMAGGSFKACDTSILITPDDSVLNLSLFTIIDNVSICGITLKSTDSKIYVNCGGDNITGNSGKVYSIDDVYFTPFSKTDLTQEIAAIKLTASENQMPVMLKIEGKGDTYNFYYAFKEGDWKILFENADGKFLSTASAGGFVGTMLGMYATSNGRPSSNSCKFDWFTYTGDDEVYKKLEK